MPTMHAMGNTLVDFVHSRGEPLARWAIQTMTSMQSEWEHSAMPKLKAKGNLLHMSKRLINAHSEGDPI